jgi:hypothetical protein
MLVAAVEGVGALPDVRIPYTRTWGSPLMAGVRAFVTAVADPSESLRDAIDRFDQHHIGGTVLLHGVDGRGRSGGDVGDDDPLVASMHIDGNGIQGCAIHVTTLYAR